MENKEKLHQKFKTRYGFGIPNLKPIARKYNKETGKIDLVLVEVYEDQGVGNGKQ